MGLRLKFGLSWRDRRGQRKKRERKNRIICHFSHELSRPQKSINSLIREPQNLSFQLGHSVRERALLVIFGGTLGLSGNISVNGYYIL